MRPTIDARHVVGFGCDSHTNPPVFASYVDDIGEIIFFLRIVVGDAIQKREQVARFNRHQAGIGQFYRFFRLGCVLLFDHFDDAAIFDDDAAIARWIFWLERQHDHRRRIRRVKPANHCLHRSGRHEGHIAIKDEDIAFKAFQSPLCLLHGMASAKLRFLQCKLCCARQSCLQLLLAATDNHNLFGRAQGIDRSHQVHQHWPARNGVQHLVQVGFHARAFARGEDDGG